MKLLRWMNRQFRPSPARSATNNNNICINAAGEGNEQESVVTTSTLLDEGGLLAIGTLGARLDLEHHPLEASANCLFDYDDLHITPNEIADIQTPPRAKLSVYINSSSSISGNGSSSCSRVAESNDEKGIPIQDPVSNPSQLNSELSVKKKLNKMSLAHKIFGSHKNNGDSKKNTPAATENTSHIEPNAIDTEPKWKLFRKKSSKLIRSPAEMKKFEGMASNRSSTSSDTSSSSDRRKSSGSDSSSSSCYSNQTRSSIGSMSKSGSSNQKGIPSDNSSYMAYCDTVVATGCQPSANEIERWIRTDHDYVVLELE